jgi:hypothetical protein
MKRTFLAVLLGLMMAVPGPASAAPEMSEYMSKPFWLEGRTIPMVLLVLERDWKMFYPAYNNLSDLDGDGVIDIGFNPNVTYVGYFDSDSCYTYSTSSGYFTRIGDATPQSAAQAAALVPAGIRQLGRDNNGDGLNDVGIETPASKHGVCNRSAATADGQGQWLGNWLNFATTSRMDAVRKVLYGGKRVTDTENQTVLELTSYLPANSHVWGGELVADNLWLDYAKTSPWYDIPSFTGYTKPENGRMHFWCRSSYYTPNVDTYYSSGANNTINSTYITRHQTTRTYSSVPLFQFAANIPSDNWHPIYATPLRIWDWVGDHGGGLLPNDWSLAAGRDPTAARAFVTANYPGTKPANQAARRFTARVEVCNKAKLGDKENCRLYGNNYKPTGLLQEYGESETMYFGLLTGSLHPDKRYQGGVVRHHIQKFANYVNQSNGLVVRPGLIDTIDRLQVTGIGNFPFGSTVNHGSYVDGTQAGNPLGEMVYEAVRYLSRSYNPSANNESKLKPMAPTTDYIPTSEVSLPVYNNPGSKSALPLLKAADWAQMETMSLGQAAEECPKPIILLLSEIFPDHDYNASSFNSNQSNFDRTPLLKNFAASSVPQKFNIGTYLDLITAQEYKENQKNGYGNELFFYPQQGKIFPNSTKEGRGVCLAHALSGGLKTINGLCPSEPSLEGSYSLAAIAYYAHTHNMYDVNDNAPSGNAERNIDLFAVGIPGNFPDITFTVDENRSLTVMPITVAQDNNESGADIGRKLRTLINFFVESWEVDSHKRPYRVEFATNFEYNTTPSWSNNSGSNNMERDVFNRFEITLLTTSATPPAYREATPIYINSGPLRTRDHAQWRQNKSAGVYPDNGNNRYYYAFRNPVYEPGSNSPALDITQFDIVGVAIYNNAHGSFINMKGNGGYTITGVKHPGPYIEVGYYGNDAYGYGCRDAAVYSGANCFGNRPVIMAGDYDFCEINPGVCVTVSGTQRDPCYYNNQLYNQYSNRRGLPPGLCNAYYSDELLTPWECPFAGYSAADRSDPEVIAAYSTNGQASGSPDPTRVCGAGAATNKYMRYVQVRSFVFDENAPKATPLPNPMKLAAKYGGFMDKDADNSSGGLGLPDTDEEWKRLGPDTDKDDPYNYFEVANISELPTQLGRAFEAIASSVATGTANAASINTVLGGGLSLQTQYRTEYAHSGEPDTVLTWTGSVYAFFVDKWGNLRADTNNDQKLTLTTSPPPPGRDNGEDLWAHMYPMEGPFRELGDLIVHTVAGDNDLGLPTVYLCRDMRGNNNGGHLMPTDKLYELYKNEYPPYADCEKVGSFEEAQTLWNVAERLAKISDPANEAQRRLYSNFDPLTVNGTADWTGKQNLAGSEFHTKNLDPLHKLMGQASKDDTRDLINYIRGVDQFPNRAKPFRNRTARLPWDDSVKQVWRMGDVINSKPVIVGEAVTNFHLLYGSPSYAVFKAGVAAYRRHAAYFGSNDGILHGINLGYFGSLLGGVAGYDKKLPERLEKMGAVANPTYANLELGDELWGYLPPAVLPHLQWLADLEYPHGYYVDLVPHITDITDENGNWRTILIVGLRLGGRTVELVNAAANEPKYSYSEFLALDVTNPDDGLPKLLWRFAHPNLGLTSAKPAVVRSQKSATGEWYVVLASGPTSDLDDSDQPGYRKPAATAAEGRRAYEGFSNQAARVFILNARTGQLVRDPQNDPSPLIIPEGNSFFNDSFLPWARHVEAGGESWSHHAVYLGTTAVDSQNRDTGALYRLQMVSADDGRPLPVNQWRLRRMYNADKPITGEVNSVRDSVNNLWVLFGTGRAWYQTDLIPCGMDPEDLDPDCCDNHDQYFFGLKEPLNDKGLMTFEEITEGGANPEIVDVSGVDVFSNGDISPVGTIKKYNDLYYLMIRKTPTGQPEVGGYKSRLESWRRLGETKPPNKAVFEMVTTQPQIDALPNGRANTIFTSYRTSANICEPSGHSFLNVVDAFTGLPAPYMSEYQGFTEGGERLLEDKPRKDVLSGIKRAGSGMASAAWVLKSGTTTVYGNTSFNSKRNMIHLPEEQSVGAGVVSWREVLDMGFIKKLLAGDETDKFFDDLKN